jgi:hypothetical protein
MARPICEDGLRSFMGVSVYPAYQQTQKLFNPILGEMYEMVNHNGVTFLAEQETTLFLQMLYNGWFKRQFTQE